MKTLTIKNGWYYGAGSPTKYDWVKDGYHIYGVGISLDFLWKTDEIEIVVAGERYRVKTQDCVDFARQYNTQEKRGTKNIIIVSKSILHPLSTVE